MLATNPRIYLGTIALEPHRWGANRHASIDVDHWIARAMEAGFDGIELWDKHYQTGVAVPPACIYNCYTPLDDSHADERARVTDICKAIGAEGLKFNVGPDRENAASEIENLLRWAETFPSDFRLLCEVHPGTWAEQPEGAERVFSQCPDPRIQAIAHPFMIGNPKLNRWFDTLGDRITHAHVQIRTPDNAFMALSEDLDRVSTAVSTMKKRGYSGTWTIEFVKGTRTREDEAERLFERAVDDMETLHELL